ncbi:MAG: hypothetical protein K2P99_02625, partial [Burkholderiales bacterium]|nr:hypothetical protein [Burkholderiales bacterium]
PYNVCSDILNAVKAHLWLSQKRQREEGKVVPILFDAFAIDEMWHTFLLFTKEYHEFSYELFNTYLHHNPCIDPEKDAILLSEAENTIRYIASYVDENTMKKWYLEWPEKYCEKKMKSEYFVFNKNFG